MHFMRAMEYVPNNDFLSFRSLSWGQTPHDFPSVFSFFDPDFSPSGPLTKAGLVAPEAFRFDTPNIVGA